MLILSDTDDIKSNNNYTTASNTASFESQDSYTLSGTFMQFLYTNYEEGSEHAEIPVSTTEEINLLIGDIN